MGVSDHECVLHITLCDTRGRTSNTVTQMCRYFASNIYQWPMPVPEILQAPVSIEFVVSREHEPLQTHLYLTRWCVSSEIFKDYVATAL